MTGTVDIICSVLNGDAYLAAALDSIRSQTHTDWRLWLRDDGSEDSSVELMRRYAAADTRIRIAHVGGPRLGVAGAYGWLLERIPADASYVMVADADDVWLANKIDVTLVAMRGAEAQHPVATPILVHTDLVVVNARLDVIHDSYWSYARVAPEPATLRRHLVRTLVVGPTIMLNAALRHAIGSTPQVAIAQDSWYGMVAITLGRVVFVPAATILYRQHGLNDSGGIRLPLTPMAVPEAVVGALRNWSALRREVTRCGEQASALLDRHGPRLSAVDRELLEAMARLPSQPLLSRKLSLLRHRVLPEFGLLRALSVVLRG